MDAKILKVCYKSLKINSEKSARRREQLVAPRKQRKAVVQFMDLLTRRMRKSHRSENAHSSESLDVLTMSGQVASKRLSGLIQNLPLQIKAVNEMQIPPVKA